MGAEKATLILEDGTTFEGKPFGKTGEAFGEVVFYTGVVGYQELITNPSWRGALAVLTYPIIGSYGVNSEDNESDAAQVGGVIIRESSPCYSNFRATGSLEDFLKERGVVGIREVDTRAVTVHVRERGEMRGAIVSGDFDPKQVAAELKRRGAAKQPDLLAEVTWAATRAPAGPERCRIALLNLGVKNSLLAQLAALGCTVDVLPASAGAKEALARKGRGVIVAGGPGDPAAAAGAADAVRSLLGKTPLLGIGLGHQVLALALGCRVRRMKVGHRGVNYPVRDVETGTSQITVQHHSYVVDQDGLPDAAVVTHVNLNDRTVEGIRARDCLARGIQFHPCPDEMGRPSAVLARFCGGTAAK